MRKKTVVVWVVALILLSLLEEPGTDLRDVFATSGADMLACVGSMIAEPSYYLASYPGGPHHSRKHPVRIRKGGCWRAAATKRGGGRFPPSPTRVSL